MRRVLQFLDWKACIWETRAEFFGLDAEAAERTTVHLLGCQLLLHRRAEGVRAYAIRQARIQRDLRAHFKFLWRIVPALVISHFGRDVNVTLDLDDHATEELSLAASFLCT
jgi:hypothetical protein